MKTTFLQKFLILALAVVQTTNISDAQSWNLVWADEFSGTTIDASNWTMEIGTGSSGWGNNEWQYYTARPQNASIVNGNLAIVAKKENYMGSNYTSARMITQGKQSWKYGKMEARIKFPLRQGIWPAFWMLGDNFGTAGWPKCGEIDIMEHINTSDKIHGTIHWDNNGYATYGGDVTIFNVNDFHTYAIEWDATGIKWFVDGNQYHSANTLNNINSTDEFHDSFFLILNMAVGGNWPGYPNTADQIQDTLLVDYVRVYQWGQTPNAINNTQSDLGQVTLYPNPIRIGENATFVLPKSGDYSIEIYNNIGVLCQQKIVSVDLQKEKTISMNDYSPGMYFIKIVQGSKEQIKKLLITP